MAVPLCFVRKFSVSSSKGVYTKHAISRIDVRLPLATREIIDHAATMQGENVELVRQE